MRRALNGTSIAIRSARVLTRRVRQIIPPKGGPNRLRDNRYIMVVLDSHLVQAGAFEAST